MTLEEPASEGTFDTREGVAAVDEVTCADVGIERFTGGVDGQSIDVVAEDFSAEVLLCGQLGHARKLLQCQTVLDPFERLLDSPPRVIEAPERGGGEGVHVEERGDEDAHLVAEHLANEANFARRGGDFVVERVLFAGGWQHHNLLGQARSAECLDSAEIEAIDPHAEMAFSLQQDGEEPVGRITSVEYQDVIGTELAEVFEEHLTLAGVGGIELGSQGHFDTGQIEREANGVDYVADESLAVTGLPEEGQAQDCGITGDDAQAVPEGKAELRVDQGQEMIVEDLKGCDRHLHSGFGKGLRRDFSHQIGAVGQVGKERVQFRLHFGGVSAEQAGDQAGETEDTCS